MHTKVVTSSAAPLIIMDVHHIHTNVVHHVSLTILQVVVGMIGRTDTYFYLPVPLQCWYLAWLLVFCWIYGVTRESESETANKSSGSTGNTGAGNVSNNSTTISNEEAWYHTPSLLRLCIWGVLLGWLNSVAMILIPGDFAYMPITFGSLPMDVAFFCGGICAKRGDWFGQGQGGLKASDLTIAYWMSCIVIILGFAFTYIMFHSSADGGLYSKEYVQNPDNRDYLFFLVVGMNTVLGPSAMCMSYAILGFFREYANFTGALQSKLASAAYTVYLVHPYIVILFTYSWTKIMSSSGVKIEFSDETSLTTTSVVPNGYVLGGWIYCMVMVQLVWPVAYCLRSIPGFDKVL